MHSLLDFLAKYYHWLLFVALEVVSLVLLFQFNYYQGSVWLTTANAAVGRANEWEQQALRYIHLGSVNEELMRRNVILEQNIYALSTQLQRLTHDSTFTERCENGIAVFCEGGVVHTMACQSYNHLCTVKDGTAGCRKPCNEEGTVNHCDSVTKEAYTSQCTRLDDGRFVEFVDEGSEIRCAKGCNEKLTGCK